MLNLSEVYYRCCGTGICLIRRWEHNTGYSAGKETQKTARHKGRRAINFSKMKVWVLPPRRKQAEEMGRLSPCRKCKVSTKLGHWKRCIFLLLALDIFIVRLQSAVKNKTQGNLALAKLPNPVLALGCSSSGPQPKSTKPKVEKTPKTQQPSPNFATTSEANTNEQSEPT